MVSHRFIAGRDVSEGELSEGRLGGDFVGAAISVSARRGTLYASVSLQHTAGQYYPAEGTEELEAGRIEGQRN